MTVNIVVSVLLLIVITIALGYLTGILRNIKRLSSDKTCDGCDFLINNSECSYFGIPMDKNCAACDEKSQS